MRLLNPHIAGFSITLVALAGAVAAKPYLLGPQLRPTMPAKPTLDQFLRLSPDKQAELEANARKCLPFAAGMRRATLASNVSSPAEKMDAFLRRPERICRDVTRINMSLEYGLAVK